MRPDFSDEAKRHVIFQMVFAIARLSLSLGPSYWLGELKNVSISARKKGIRACLTNSDLPQRFTISRNQQFQGSPFLVACWIPVELERWTI